MPVETPVPTCRVPALMVIVPVLILVPERTIVPVPFLA